jgi:hypothetical protein
MVLKTHLQEKMKHVFWVHSYITYFIAKKIIEQNKLDKNEVIFLKDRDFEIYDPYIEFLQPDLRYKFSVGNLLRNWRLIRRYDQWIERITDRDQYILYYPHTGLRHLDYLLTHKNCRGYCLVEEGTAAYSNNLRPLKYRKKNFSVMGIKYLVMYKGRVRHSRDFYNDDYLHAYGLSELAFAGFPRRVIFDSRFKTSHGNSPAIGKNALLFLLSCLVETNQMDTGKYMDAVMDSLEKFFDRYEKESSAPPRVLYIKPHPQTDVDSPYFSELMERIKALYSSRVEIRPWTFGPVETFLDNGGLTLLSIDSSVVLYAAMNDLRVYCCQDIFLPHVRSATYRRMEDIIPPALAEKIHFIN